MKKSKGETIELLYTNKSGTNKKTKNKPKKNTKTKKVKTNNNENNTRINLDNEIIIGLTPKKNNTKKKSKKTISNSKSKNKKKLSPKKFEAQKTRQATTKVKRKTDKKQPKKNKICLKIFKWTSILILMSCTIVLFMMSSVFNIKQIVVLNNNKVSSEEIINLSGLATGINMFKIRKSEIRNKIKTNSYIENVHTTRNINGTLTLEIEERTPTYMLKFANAYVYINNQGYMLEITEVPLELPMITGFKTPAEAISEGNRLIIEDLKKLEDVIKIMESAKSNSLAKIITEIDISDSKNYLLTIASESKKVQFGECANINIKLLKIEALIEQEKGIAGEIYFQDSERTVFKEEVKR